MAWAEDLCLVKRWPPAVQAVKKGLAAGLRATMQWQGLGCMPGSMPGFKAVSCPWCVMPVQKVGLDGCNDHPAQGLSIHLYTGAPHCMRPAASLTGPCSITGAGCTTLHSFCCFLYQPIREESQSPSSNKIYSAKTVVLKIVQAWSGATTAALINLAKAVQHHHAAAQSSQNSHPESSVFFAGASSTFLSGLCGTLRKAHALSAPLAARVSASLASRKPAALHSMVLEEGKDPTWPRRS